MQKRNEKTMYIYIMSGHSRRLYTGVTNNLERRVWEHKGKLIPGFTSRYSFHLLVYYEAVQGSMLAIEREKEIKGWRRERKLKLIESLNPEWEDLSAGWSE